MVPWTFLHLKTANSNGGDRKIVKKWFSATVRKLTLKVNGRAYWKVTEKALKKKKKKKETPPYLCG